MIDAILDAARVAPSGKNAQPWRFVVLGGESKAAFCACMEAGLQREADAPLLPEPEAKAAAVRITLGSEVVDEFVMEGGETDGGA